MRHAGLLMLSGLDVTGDAPTPPEAGFPAEELFAASNTAVLIADVATGNVIAANPAAQRLLGMARSDLVGRSWHRAFSQSSVPALGAAAGQAIASGTAVKIAASSSTGAAALTATFSTFQVSRTSYLVVRLNPDASCRAPSAAVFDELDAFPQGFVITDGAFCVEFGNKAFLELVNQSSNDDVKGLSLLVWLNLTSGNLAQLTRQMASREAATWISTTLCIGPALGPLVEVTAVAVPDATAPHWGFVLRKQVSPSRPPRQRPANA